MEFTLHLHLHYTLFWVTNWTPETIYHLIIATLMNIK